MTTKAQEDRERRLAYRVVENQLQKLKNVDAPDVVAQVWKDANVDVTEPLVDVMDRVSEVSWLVENMVEDLLSDLRSARRSEGLL